MLLNPNREEYVRRLSLLMAAIAGGVDGVAIILFAGMLTSYMTGNSIGSTAAIVLGRFADLLPHLLPIPMFALGVFVASSVIEVGTRKRSGAFLTVVLAIESALLTLALMVGGPHGRGAYPGQDPLLFVVVSFVAMAMGMHDTTIRDGNGRLILSLLSPDRSSIRLKSSLP
jgi:uncharacterized membrane protein YoaK (UPF0700 family)